MYKNRKEPKKNQEPSKLEPNRTGTENGTETGTGTTLVPSPSKRDERGRTAVNVTPRVSKFCPPE